jgi:hypothetical protein
VTDVNGFEVEYGEFHAYRDHMGKTFRVTGDVVVPHGGVAVDLLSHEGPGGINERILPLDLVFVLTGESPSEQPVEWPGNWDDSDYDEVEFRLRGGEGEVPAPIPVETLE